MPALNPDVDPTRCRMLGLGGSVALLAGGTTAGALPFGEAFLPSSGRAALGLVCASFGVVLLIAAWWWLGRAVRGPRPPSPRELRLTLVVWAAPLLFGPPLFSRDVYSYLAQGAMVGSGIDVYAYGPQQLGGPLAAEVAPVWQYAPAPYGPVFLAPAARVAALTHVDLAVGIAGMRLVALLGVALMVVSLPALARRCGVEPSAAVWLGALNPLILLHLVAGAHNDAMMMGLLGVGLVAALGGRPARATVLIALAALVKAPAALGLFAVVPLWAGGLTGRARTFRAGGLTAAVALVTTVAVTAAAGTGYGWVGALSSPVSPGNWSLTSALGRLTGTLFATGESGFADVTVPAWRWFGLLATVVAVAVLWTHRERLGAVYSLALGLLAVCVLGPAFRPWYALWALFLIAAAAPPGRVRRWTPLGSGLLALVLLPSGSPPDRLQLTLAVCGGTLALVALWWIFFLASDHRAAVIRPKAAA